MLYCDCSRTTRLCRRNKLVGEKYGQQKTQRNRHNRLSGNRVNRVERRCVLVRHAERRVGRISTRRVAIRDARANERSGATAVGANGFFSDNRIGSNSQPKLQSESPRVVRRLKADARNENIIFFYTSPTKKRTASSGLFLYIRAQRAFSFRIVIAVGSVSLGRILIFRLCFAFLAEKIGQ